MEVIHKLLELILILISVHLHFGNHMDAQGGFQGWICCKVFALEHKLLEFSFYVILSASKTPV